MLRKDLIYERRQYLEAIRYGKTFTGVQVEKVVSIDELPKSIQSMVDEVIKISSVPTARLAHDCSTDELSQWVIDLLSEPSGSKVFFKPAGDFWKFWFLISIVDFKDFINNYLMQSRSKDFFLADILGNYLKALMDEEYSYDLFIK
ncbi:hypothetical protein [Hymenobacter terrenus]|uniref:hypothetical protein n=1 Tax=Hymenobacter terrenus TaxID=1629124 RepID=UPI00061953C4|nr:hypothetical protein [Hymenobacter terrenus]